MATAASNLWQQSLESGGSRPRTAFVLSGGASLGALQVGMLDALYERQIFPDVLVGTSVGALNAAFIASRAPTITTAKALAGLWCSLERQQIFPVSLSALVGGLRGRRDHLVPDFGLRRLVRHHIEFDDIADAPIPLHLVAFDLMEGREVLVSEGPAVDSVLAAASIPGVFSPVAIGDRRLVDGGVVNNTPISHAVELGAERIYILPTVDPSDHRLDRAPKTALDAAIHGVGLLVQSRFEADLARYSRQAELIVLPAPNPRGIQPTSFEHSAHLIAAARSAAQAALAHHHLERHLRLVV